MHIVFIVLIGFLVGLVARWIAPSPHLHGFWITSVVGIVGSVIATYGGQALGFYRVGRPAGRLPRLRPGRDRALGAGPALRPWHVV
ncbi:MAG: GlsB/YeaQ/YmgE family stress response membrane protein [Reyranellales bacterium]